MPLLAIFLFISLPCDVSTDDRRYALAPIEVAGNIPPAASQLFYDSLVLELNRHHDVYIIERAQMRRVFQEADLLAVLAPDRATQVHRQLGRQLSAEVLLVPGLSRINADYFMTLRELDLHSGNTIALRMETARGIDRLTNRTKRLVGIGVSDTKRQQPQPWDTELMDRLHRECVRNLAGDLFPALWARIDALRADHGQGETASIDRYYLWLLNLCARASDPPDGMVFIPGGEVELPTPRGPRRAWVEPFWIEKFEVSVAQYKHVLADDLSGPEARRFTPLASQDAHVAATELPVTGISWKAASAFASRKGRQLATQSQWLRACQASVGPQAETRDCRRPNLLGGDDGYVVLAPAATPGDDVSPLGVRGLTGNVREWTATWDNRNLYRQSRGEPPIEPEDGTLRIVMGAGWRTPPAAGTTNLVSAVRPGEAYDDVGFRCSMPFLPGTAEWRLGKWNDPRRSSGRQ